MNTIDLQSLLREGYQENKAAIRKFERRYAPITIPGVIGFAFGLYLAFVSDLKSEGWIVSGISFIVTAIACFHAYFAIPRSLKSGLLMEKYKRIGGVQGQTEIIYVDRSSRTFCRRVVATDGD